MIYYENAEVGGRSRHGAAVPAPAGLGLTHHVDGHPTTGPPGPRQSKQPLGTFELQGSFQVKNLSPVTYKIDYGFEIVTRSNRYLLQAAAAVEREEWTAALNNVSQSRAYVHPAWRTSRRSTHSPRTQKLAGGRHLRASPAPRRRRRQGLATVARPRRPRHGRRRAVPRPTRLLVAGPLALRRSTCTRRWWYVGMTRQPAGVLATLVTHRCERSASRVARSHRRRSRRAGWRSWASETTRSR